MKKLIAIAMVMGSATSAYADGFKCETRSGDLNVKVYNSTSASEGTRNGAVMIISDATVQAGRKTIASFSNTKKTLTNSGAHYVANVDLRVVESRRQGELIGGTKLGQLDTIELAVEFKYNKPVAAGEMVAGTLTLTKRNGETIDLDLDCARYLKN
jgi:hypothetical protein